MRPNSNNSFSQPLARRPRLRRRTLFKILAAIATLGMIVLSMLPTRFKAVFHTTGRLHSTGHFLIFAVISYIAARTTRILGVRLLLFAVVIFFAGGIEFAEHLVYGSAMEWKDVVVDSFGALLGAVAAHLSTQRRQAAYTPLAG